MLDACFLICSVQVFVIAGMFIFLICFVCFSAVFGICHLYASRQVDFLLHKLRMFPVSVLCISSNCLVMFLGSFLLCSPVSPGYFPDRSWWFLHVSECLQYVVSCLCFVLLLNQLLLHVFVFHHVSYKTAHVYVCVQHTYNIHVYIYYIYIHMCGGVYLQRWRNRVLEKHQGKMLL